MPETRYRPPNAVLAELILGVTGAAPPPPAPAAARPPGAMDNIKALEDQAFAPDPQAPGPAKVGFGKTLLAALASGLGTYGSVIGGGGQVDYLTPIRERAERERGEKHAGAVGEHRLKQRKAQYLIDKSNIEASRKLDIEAEERARKARLDEIEAKAVIDAQKRADDAALDEIKFERGAKLDIYMQGERFKHEDALKTKELAAKSGDKGAEKDLELFSVGATIANNFLRGIKENGQWVTPPLIERLRSGESPEEVIADYKRELSGAGVFRDGRGMSLNYMNAEIIRLWKKVQEEAERGVEPMTGP